MDKNWSDIVIVFLIVASFFVELKIPWSFKYSLGKEKSYFYYLLHSSNVICTNFYNLQNLRCSIWDNTSCWRWIPVDFFPWSWRARCRHSMQLKNVLPASYRQLKLFWKGELLLSSTTHSCAVPAFRNADAEFVIQAGIYTWRIYSQHVQFNHGILLPMRILPASHARCKPAISYPRNIG